MCHRFPPLGNCYAYIWPLYRVSPQGLGGETVTQNGPVGIPHVGLTNPGPHRLRAIAELSRHPFDGPVVSAPLGAQLANQPHRLGLLCVRVPPRRRMPRRCLCRHSHILAFPSSGPSGKVRAIHLHHRPGTHPQPAPTHLTRPQRPAQRSRTPRATTRTSPALQSCTPQNAPARTHAPAQRPPGPKPSIPQTRRWIQAKRPRG